MLGSLGPKKIAGIMPKAKRQGWRSAEDLWVEEGETHAIGSSAYMRLGILIIFIREDITGGSERAPRSDSG